VYRVPKIDETEKIPGERSTVPWKVAEKVTTLQPEGPGGGGTSRGGQSKDMGKKTPERKYHREKKSLVFSRSQI